MNIDLGDLNAFMAVARMRGFREGARSIGSSASGLSLAVRRLESQLGVRLLHRTTRSVVPTEAGQRLLERLGPALGEVASALDVVNGFRDKPAGTLRLNVPMGASRLVLPALVPEFLQAFPDIQLDVVVEDGFVDLLASGCDAGIRYDDRLEQDMVAVPIGPRVQRFAAAASPAYLDRRGRPAHPRELLQHDCLRGRFASGTVPPWDFERAGESVRVDPVPRMVVRLGAAADLAVDAAVGGAGVIYMFEDWLRPYLSSGQLEPVLAEWWPSFSGPFLYFSGRTLLPAPLRAFVDFVRERSTPDGAVSLAVARQAGRRPLC
ncbi:LysR family transcriptional regulator [Acidovorax sp. Leaf160]|uniref:LysR family transcriptional regulator n=1 Tax=Acidovorax sp. Leaf160 TaxID=1736280 RepID=UPI0006FD1CDF|nr:LysR family transcriptional regulator [Acidovorax sp. Leaf160]KQR62588.1 LysR family transcriptional regulator [Acidovorax sp. Leaf160]